MFNNNKNKKNNNNVLKTALGVGLLGAGSYGGYKLLRKSSSNIPKSLNFEGANINQKQLNASLAERKRINAKNKGVYQRKQEINNLTEKPISKINQNLNQTRENVNLYNNTLQNQGFIEGDVIKRKGRNLLGRNKPVINEYNNLVNSKNNLVSQKQQTAKVIKDRYNPSSFSVVKNNVAEFDDNRNRNLAIAGAGALGTIGLGLAGKKLLSNIGQKKIQETKQLFPYRFSSNRNPNPRRGINENVMNYPTQAKGGELVQSSEQKLNDDYFQKRSYSKWNPSKKQKVVFDNPLARKQKNVERLKTRNRERLGDALKSVNIAGKGGGIRGYLQKNYPEFESQFPYSKEKPPRVYDQQYFDSDNNLKTRPIKKGKQQYDAEVQNLKQSNQESNIELLKHLRHYEDNLEHDVLPKKGKLREQFQNFEDEKFKIISSRSYDKNRKHGGRRVRRLRKKRIGVGNTYQYGREIPPN